MISKTINEIEQIYDLEIDKTLKNIIKQKAKKVLLQFPEGMKPYAQSISDKIESKTKCQCFIWLGTCFGACDLPLEVEKLKIDLIIQFGHSKWNYKNPSIKELTPQKSTRN